MNRFVYALSSNLFNLPVDGVRVIIITGQSNASGRGLITNTPSEELGVKNHINIWHSGGGQFVKLNIGDNNLYGAPNSGLIYHGIENGLAIEFLNVFPNEELYIIKYAIGGTPIINHIPGGSVYETLKNNYVIPAINDLINSGKRPYIYFFFHQGEGDADSQAEIDVYKSQLDLMTSSWETTVGLGVGTPFNYAEILELQSISGAIQINQIFYDKAIEKVYYDYISAKDLPNKTGDNLHFNHSALNTIASRLLFKMKLQIPKEVTDLTMPENPELISVELE